LGSVINKGRCRERKTNKEERKREMDDLREERE